MHISLDAALQRQPLLSTVGDKLLPSFSGAAAAYSLRALNGDANDVVRVRRDADDEERDFTAEGVALELEDWVNGKLEDTLPADSSYGAAAAYSLRKVNPDYSGNAVQIRRASDNVEVNVAFDSNGEVSTSSAITNVVESPDAGETTATTLGEFLTEGGNQDATVVTWYDQSGNGNDATQDTTGEQPLIVEGGSLLGELKFDGIDDFMQSDVSTSGNDTTILVAKNNSTTGASVFLDTQYGGAKALYVTSSNFQAFYGSSTDLNYGILNNNYNLHFISTNATDSNNRYGSLNGIVDSLDSGTNNYSAINIGLSRVSTSPLNGNIKEIIIYDSDQSDNRFKIESNINNYYGIYTPAYDGFVETWYDQSGNGNHAEQDFQADQPKIVSAGSLITNNEGKVAIEGDTGKSFDVTPVTGIADLSVFFVGETPSASTALLGWTNNAHMLRFANNNWELVASSVDPGNMDWDTLLTSGETVLFNFERSSGPVTGYANSVASATTSNPNTNAFAFNRIFTRSSVTFNDYVGKATELIIYDSDQSANRTAIESNIADEYGITLS